MLPSDSARKPKITSWAVFFFKGADVSIIIDGIDVMAMLEGISRIMNARQFQMCSAP